jgi:hypothetical protein
MKKYLYLFVLIMAFAVTAGCSNYANPLSAQEGDKVLAQGHFEKPEDTTLLQPTKYETINNFDDVKMTIKEGSVLPSGLTVVFENASQYQCIFGEFFILEKKINGAWYEVAVTINGNYGFRDIGYDLAAGEVREKEVDWQWLYGDLSNGEYRIVKDILNLRGAGDFDTYYLSWSFTIK